MHKREPPRDSGTPRGSDPDRADETAVDLIDRLGGYDDLIAQGAEGRVFAVTFLNRPAIVKQRFKKTYRHPTLDAKITRARLVGETRALVRARRLGVPTPSLFYVDKRQNAIYMERVPGRPLKELIREGMSDEDMEEVGKQVGKHVAAMHDGGLIHGDLTTSNILVVRDEDVDEPKNAAAKPRVYS